MVGGKYRRRLHALGSCRAAAQAAEPPPLQPALAAGQFVGHCMPRTNRGEVLERARVSSRLAWRTGALAQAGRRFRGQARLAGQLPRNGPGQVAQDSRPGLANGRICQAGSPCRSRLRPGNSNAMCAIPRGRARSPGPSARRGPQSPAVLTQEPPVAGKTENDGVPQVRRRSHQRAKAHCRNRARPRPSCGAALPRLPAAQRLHQPLAPGRARGGARALPHGAGAPAAGAPAPVAS